MNFLSDFGVQPVLLAAQVVNFLILLLILKKLLYGPILKVLADRRKRIEDSLKNAEEIERKLLETNERAEKIIAKTLDESKKILDDTKVTAFQILDDARAGAVEILNKAREQALEVIKAERVNLEKQMKENLGSILTLVFEKVTGKKIIEKSQKEIIEKEVKNLS